MESSALTLQDRSLIFARSSTVQELRWFAKGNIARQMYLTSFFRITTTDHGGRSYRMWRVHVRQCRAVAQIEANGLVYQRQKGGINCSDARPSKWPRSKVI